MCGIAGYKGTHDANQVVIEGLRRLEYRGYDSWGIASISQDHIELLRREGRIGQVSIQNVGKSSGISIGHTRWATHGGVCESNAHPHLSFDSKVAVVHNGIIENFQELRHELEHEGICLKSQTDTEVIPHLIALQLKKEDISFSEAVRMVCGVLKGSFAIVAVHQDFDEIVVARDGSPVVIGVHWDESEKEFFVASDVTAFLDRTKQVVYLRDGDLAVINSRLDVFRISDASPVQYKIEMVPWSLEEAAKGEFHYFMEKEIHEQPQSVINALNQDQKTMGIIIGSLEKASRIFLVGCGTSAHAAWAGQMWLRTLGHVDAQVVLASEFEMIGPLLTSKDVVVALSQSGETADVLAAVKSAKLHGVTIISIVNVIGSTLARQSDAVLLMRSGPEICVLATKSYLAELTILANIACRLGKEWDCEKSMASLSSIINSVITSTSDHMKALAPRISSAKDVLMIGRGRMFPTALEAALKLKEVSYLHAEGFAGGELKHGSIALVEKGVPVIVFADNDSRDLIISNAMEVKARGGWVIGVDSKPNEAYDVLIQVPDAGVLQPMISVIPLQLLSYFVAVHKGLDPDKPRNLAKSVTVK